MGGDTDVDEEGERIISLHLGSDLVGLVLLTALTLTTCPAISATS